MGIDNIETRNLDITHHKLCVVSAIVVKAQKPHLSNHENIDYEFINNFVLPNSRPYCDCASDGGPQWKDAVTYSVKWQSLYFHTALPQEDVTSSLDAQVRTLLLIFYCVRQEDEKICL